MPEDENKLEGQENGEIQELADQISENLTGEGGEAPENQETPDNSGEEPQPENDGTDNATTDSEPKTESAPEPEPTPETPETPEESTPETPETPEESSDDEESTEEPNPEPEVLGQKLTDKQIEEVREFLKKAPKTQEEAFQTIEEMVKLCIANQGFVLSGGLYEFKTWESIKEKLLWWCDKAPRFNVAYPLETMLVGYLIDNKAVIGY